MTDIPHDKPLPYSEVLSHWLLVSEIYQKCQRVLQRELRTVDLNIAQHDVLVAIKSHPGLTQRELADVLYVVKSNITALVRKLEGRGFVVRTPDADDGRSIRLSLTEEGLRQVRVSLQVQRRIVSAMMGPLDPTEIRALAAAMRRAGAALDELPLQGSEDEAY